MTDVIDILGVPVGCYTLPEAVERLAACLATPGCSYSYGVNAQTLNLAYDQPEFRQVLQAAEVVYADGASLKLAARLLGGPRLEKITTTDLWDPLCRRAAAAGWRLYLLGGPPGLAVRVRQRARRDFPGLQIVGVHDGYHGLWDPATVAAINAASPDLLWVGLGDPLQGFWIHHWQEKLQIRLALTCGGMFKIIAGELRRVGPFWQQHGLEWLYRLWQEPQSWRRYLLGLPLFGVRVLRQAWSRRSPKTSLAPPPV